MCDPYRAKTGTDGLSFGLRLDPLQNVGRQPQVHPIGSPWFWRFAMRGRGAPCGIGRDHVAPEPSRNDAIAPFDRPFFGVSSPTFGSCVRAGDWGTGCEPAPLCQFYHISRQTWPNWVETMDSEANRDKLTAFSTRRRFLVRNAEPILTEKSYDPS
jgi:hypothetical protein